MEPHYFVLLMIYTRSDSYDTALQTSASHKGHTHLCTAQRICPISSFLHSVNCSLRDLPKLITDCVDCVPYHDDCPHTFTAGGVRLRRNEAGAADAYDED